MNIMRNFTTKTIVICFAAIFFSCQDGEKKQEDEISIVPAEEKKDDMGEEDRPMSRSYLLARMRENEELSSFLEEFQSSGLEEEFEGEEGAYTFFVPSNAAYDRIPALEISPDDTAGLQRRRNNMKYYMVEGELTVDYLREKIAASEDERYEFRTALGEKLWATEKDGKIILTDVLGNQAAILTSNMNEYYGVYHIIDNVLRPEEEPASK